MCFQEVEEIISYGPNAEKALKLLVTTVKMENLHSLLWSLLVLDDEEYEEKFDIVYYLMYMYVNRDLLRESLDSFVIDVFHNPVGRKWLGRSYDIYHKLLM